MIHKTYWCVVHECTGAGAINPAEDHRPQVSGTNSCYRRAWAWEAAPDDPEFYALGECDMRPASVEYGVTADEIGEYLGVPE